MTAARVVHVTTTDMSLALLLGSQLRAFCEAGYEVYGASAPGPYVGELEEAGIRHVRLRHTTRAAAPHRDLAALFELRSVFRRLRPHLVHTHNPKPGIYGRMAAAWAGVPAIVNTVHGLYAQPDDPWSRRAVVYRLERLAAARSHAELVQNEEDLATLRRLGVPDEKLHLLGNGVDLGRFDRSAIPVGTRAALRAAVGAGPEHVLVGAVGRLVLEKGYRELFEAAATLRRRCPSVLVVVVGPHDDHKRDAVPQRELEWAQRECGVRFLGHRRDLEALYTALDLYVLASYREGFPRSAMEAAAMGLPIVATNVRGCRQVVDEGVTGLLVPARDPPSLAAAVEALAVDPRRRAAMGEAGARKAQREFDERRVVDLTLRVYEDLLARAPRRT